MTSDTLTRKHWILLVLLLLFFNIICWGCGLVVLGGG